MADKSVRQTAYEILDPILKDGLLYRQACRNEAAAVESLSESDRRFLRHLTKGVLEQKPALDAILSKLLKKPLTKQPPGLVTILSMGLYELYFMRTENYAAVNEYVRLAASNRLGGLKGVVNSVLRKADTERESLLSGLSLSEKAGISTYLWKKLKSWYPENYQTIASHLIDPKRPLTVRRMISKASEKDFLDSLSHDGVTAEKHSDVRNAYDLFNVGDLTALEAFRKGWLYVQDASSILACDHVADLIRNAVPGAGFAVLDLCAAPGGKTIGLADEALYRAEYSLYKEGAHSLHIGRDALTDQQILKLMSGRYRFTACDLSVEKTALIRENAERLGFPFIEVLQSDADVDVPSFHGAYDLVIADVPCSGIGIIGEKPDIQLHLSDAYLNDLAALQQKILMQAVRYVRPGGTLAYSTCTLNPSENADQVRWLTDTFPEFEAVRDRTCLPGIDDMRGFYMARLQKKG